MDGICGSNSGNGKITRCYNTGNISALVDDIGGIIGINYALIQSSYSIGNIDGGNFAVGGIVGYGVTGQSIIKCYSLASVKGKIAVGGITGTAQIGECIDCKWYSKDLYYGIGYKESNEGAIYDENLTVSELIKILE